MIKSTILHSPTLESVIMVEKTIQKYSQECGKYQLWKKLPKKMMYQTFQLILDYLDCVERQKTSLRNIWRKEDIARI